MGSVSKVWPARLLAALTALALVTACVIGAYAHAAGHTSPPAERTEAGSGPDGAAGHRHGPAAKAAATEPRDLGHDHGHSHDGDGTSHSHLDCCDTICHGGQAILATDALVLPTSHTVPVIGSGSAFAAAEPGGLDRPPKALRPA